jgi:phage virion morphogenesis protein
MVAVNVKGLDELIRGSEEMAARLADMGPVMAVAAEDLRAFVDDRFETGTDPQGDEWHSLEPATIRKRRKGGAGGQPTILVDTATLRNSTTAESTGDSLIVGTNVDYAAAHQLGTESMFERPFIPTGEDFKSGIGQAEMKNIKRMVTAWILRGELG